MDLELEVEVFRAGDYGPRGQYAEKDLDQIAADYSAERHEAPVTLDHRQEGPALGWVRSLRRIGNILVARLAGMAPSFIEQLRAGAFKKRSVEIYRSNEATGKPYLKAVSFLGACPPVVKGLADPVFSESADAACIEFAEGESPIAHEESPSIAASNEPANAPEQTAFALPDQESQSFCEALRAEGKLLPAWCDAGLAAFMSRLDDATPVRFADAETATPQTQRAFFREFLEKLSPIVPMGEIAPTTPDGIERSVDSFAIPQAGRGVTLDSDSISLHQRACLYRQSHPRASYAEALCAIVVQR